MFKVVLIVLALLAACPDCHPDHLCGKRVERTIAIIKPDAYKFHEKIEAYFEDAHLQIVEKKTTKMTPDEARKFYASHKDKPFFDDLVSFMSSGPIEVLLLEGVDAVATNRQIIGSTNPKEAAPGTIRANYGTAIGRNAVHGSDSLENAQKEIQFFFPK